MHHREGRPHSLGELGRRLQCHDRTLPAADRRLGSGVQRTQGDQVAGPYRGITRDRVPDLIVVADDIEAAMNADEELSTLFLAVLGPGIAPRGKALADGIDERGDHEPVDVPGVWLADVQG